MTGNVTPIKAGINFPPSMVKTRTYEAVLRALDRAHGREKMTLIAGAPGIGKTKALWSYFNANPEDCIFYTAHAGEGGVFNLARGLCNQLELKEPTNAGVRRARDDIAQAIGVGRLLIVDEAQYLVQINPKGSNNPEALEWLRGISEQGYFGVALVGDLSLRDTVKTLPQLDRRTHPRVIVEYVPEDDVKALCEAQNLTNPKIIDLLWRKARLLGGLGYVSEVLADARDMSDTGSPNNSDFMDAIKGFEKGWR